MCHHLRGNKQAFQWSQIYCQKALLQKINNQPNTNFFTFSERYFMSSTLTFFLKKYLYVFSHHTLFKLTLCYQFPP